MPKLQRIDGKVRHYPYTPAGRAAYLRDKAKQDNTAEGRRQSKMGIDESGLGTDGEEGFKSIKEETAKKQKTKQRTRSKY